MNAGVTSKTTARSVLSGSKFYQENSWTIKNKCYSFNVYQLMHLVTQRKRFRSTFYSSFRPKSEARTIITPDRVTVASAHTAIRKSDHGWNAGVMQYVLLSRPQRRASWQGVVDALTSTSTTSHECTNKQTVTTWRINSQISVKNGSKCTKRAGERR